MASDLPPTATLDQASPSRPTRLDGETIEAIAQRVAAILRTDLSAESLVSAAEIARRFRVSRAWVYENAQRLGAIRLGNGSRARLRFDPHEVARRLHVDKADQSPTPDARAKSGWIDDGDLIPIRGL